ncbi:DUF4102 domain-containing protein [Chlorobium phaeovibrioides]|uniref:DUF4102 domain-containing protein n=1 Tax=Chlorobium phaeovibrioides TaxID=1094 RepID=A0A5M8I921_CHLPH|nr:integrase arm-type DNA-binding domain-containing protein [Chlorobium phaeovibrioides]KAA6230664.1 DUF4102 domain-containing protein [Chlorobium phaeovibrioides]
MPKKIAPLSALQVKAAKPTDKTQALFDGGGLYLEIGCAKFSGEKELPSSKSWKMKYRHQGKACKISIGKYPDVSLEEARLRRQGIKAQLAQGISPMDDRRRVIKESADAGVVKDAFEAIAEDWMRVTKGDWAEGYYRTVKSRLHQDAYPVIGSMSINEITTQDVLRALRIVEDRGSLESARRVRLHISQVFDYASIIGVEGLIGNPATGLNKALQSPATKHMAAITDKEELARLLQDVERYQGGYTTKCALRLGPMLFVRPGELRHAKWADIDLDDAVWNMPVEDLKLTKAEKSRRKGQVHTVPLAKQAVDILTALHLFTGRHQYVFAGRNGRPMSNNTVLNALRSMGWSKEMVTGHGFRATARTMLDEDLGWRVDIIEHQLAHAVKDANGRAYNRTSFLQDRREMMQVWADFLDRLKTIRDKDEKGGEKRRKKPIISY